MCSTVQQICFQWNTYILHFNRPALAHHFHRIPCNQRRDSSLEATTDFIRVGTKNKQIERIKWIFFNLFVSACDVLLHSIYMEHDADRREKLYLILLTCTLLSALYTISVDFVGFLFLKKKTTPDLTYDNVYYKFVAGCIVSHSIANQHQVHNIFWMRSTWKFVHVEPSTQQIEAETLHQVDILREQTDSIHGRRWCVSA